MNRQIEESQRTALGNLYNRIEQITNDMNGTSEEMNVPKSLPSQMCDGPSSQSVSALRVKLPGDLTVDFTPKYPLGSANALWVPAKRTCRSGILSDMLFSFVGEEWRSDGKALSDEMIRECLTPKSPPPIY